MNMKKLLVVASAVTLAWSVSAAWKPGLLGGKVSGAFNKTDLPSETAAYLAPHAASNNVTAAGGVWASCNNTTWVYTGQIYLDGAVTFAENIDDSVYLAIDGTKVLEDTAWNTATCGSYTPEAPGWYSFELRLGNGTGGAGPYVANGWTATKGFGMASGILTSKLGGDYELPADPGDKTLFRYDDGNGFADSLEIIGVPTALGTVQPAYGAYSGLAMGDTRSIDVPSRGDFIMVTASQRACCTGLVETVYDDETGLPQRVTPIAVDALPYAYTHAGMTTIQVLWKVENLLTVAADAGGSVSLTESWGDSVTGTTTVSAEAEEGYVFYAWTGDVSAAQCRNRTVTLDHSQPRAIRAVFGNVLYVSPEGSDASDGSSWSSAFLTLSNAVEKASDGAVVRVAGGRYQIDAELVIDKGISIVGLEGAANTTLFQKPAGVAQSNGTKYGFNMIKLDHADALLAGFTLTGVVIDGDYSKNKGAFTITTNGGVVRDCIISGNKSVTYHIKGIGASVFGGLVDSCVFKDNSEGNGDASGVVYITGGELRNSLVVNNVIQRGAVYVGPSLANPVTLRNCTISGNRPVAGNTSRYGTGLYVDVQAKAQNAERLLVENTVMWGNEGSAATDYGYPNWQIDTRYMTYLVTNQFFNCCSTVVCGPNDSIAADPLFADATNGDYSLLASSPLVDAGRTTDNTRDFAGLARPSGVAYDIGAYEYDQSALSAAFAVDTPRGFVGDAVELTPTVFGASSTENLTYAWEVVNLTTGERLTGTERVFALAAPGAGKYNVRLTVTDGGVSPVKSASYFVPSAFVRIAPVMYVKAKNAAATFPYDTEEIAASSLVDVNELALDGAVVRLLPGVHELTTQLIVESGVSYVGQGEGVIIKQTKDGERVIYMDHPDARFEHVAITGGRMGSNNSLGGKYPYSRNQHGCGVRIGVSGGTLLDCVITNNVYREYYAYGGGVGMLGGRVDRCLIAANQICSGNTSTADGGGAYVGGGILENCVITGNKVLGKAGGVCINSASAIVRNCTVYGNESSSANAGGFYYGAGTVLNCAVYANVSSELANFGPADYAESANILNCASAEGFGTDAVTCANPQFADVANWDFAIALGSDLVNAGLAYAGAAEALDFAGNDRVSGGAIDIGAYELSMASVNCGIAVAPKTEFYLGTNVTLTATVTGVEDTSELTYAWTVTSPNVPTVTGEGAAFVFTPVTGGHYDVELTVSGTPSGTVSTKAVGLLNVVPQVLYADAANAAGAQFPWNTPETAHTNLNELAAFTIDGCEINLAAGTYAITNVLDVRYGVTIRGAGYKTTVIRYDGNSHRMLYVTHPNTRIEGVTFTGSRATHQSGTDQELGRYVEGSVLYLGEATLSNCRVTACTNTTASTHGIVFVKGGLIDRCLIDENYVHNTVGSFEADGLLRAEGGSRIRNTILARNYATRGGGLAVGGSDVVVENCTIVGNGAQTGGGVYLWAWCQSKIRNCIIWGNTSSNATGTMYNNADIYYADGANVYPDIVFANTCTPVAIGTNCVTDDPQVKDVVRGDFHLRGASPCRKRGLYQDWMAEAVDFYGEPRAVRTRVDIGAVRVTSGLMVIVR